MIASPGMPGGSLKVDLMALPSATALAQNLAARSNPATGAAHNTVSRVESMWFRWTLL